MEGCKTIYCVQRRPVSSCHTLLISGYTSAVHSPFGSDSFSALQSEGRLLPLPLMSLVVKGATTNPGPHLSDETYEKLRTASPHRSYLCPWFRYCTTLRSVHTLLSTDMRMLLVAGALRNTHGPPVVVLDTVGCGYTNW